MSLPIQEPFAPMEAESAAAIPEGPEWQYEPKWDGFRCIAFRDRHQVSLQSKSCQSLTRYFPEVAEALQKMRPSKFVVDGEIIVPLDSQLSFDDLLQRMHPAESRIRRLAREHPAMLVIFDLLVDEHGKSLVDKTLAERRCRLERFARECIGENAVVKLSPATKDLQEAKRWFKTMGGGLDGIVAKRRDVSYLTGERRGMEKIKDMRTADCVVGGFRYGTRDKTVSSLLLGLYDDAGILHHVGFTSAIQKAEKAELTRKLEAIEHAPGFTGRSPGGPGRWSTARSGDWTPVSPKYVVEVQYDHFSGGRFRHGTRLLGWRPDKSPEQCKLQQVEKDSMSPLGLLKAS